MNDPSKELFDNYKNFYDSKRLPDRSLSEINTYHFDRLPRWLNRVDKSARMLDAGCANGYLLSLLHQTGYRNLAGVDLSAQLAEQAKARLPESAKITVSDIREFLSKTPDNSFDVIVFHHVLEHIPREHTLDLLRDFRRCLVPGGFLSLKVPNALSLAAGYACFGDFTHVVHFNEKSLLQVVEGGGFSVKKTEFILHPPMLFWPWRHPVRVIFRLLNRLRWHLNNGLHQALFILTDVHPMPRVFENEIEILATK